MQYSKVAITLVTLYHHFCSMAHRVRDQLVMKKFGERLREVRIKQGMTQEDLAFSADIAVSSVGRIETGQLNTTIGTIASLADALKIDKMELLDF